MEPDRIFIDIKTCDMTLSQVMLGLEYKDTKGVPVGEYYASNALAVSKVQYRVSGDSDWGMLTGSSIGAVGQYRISFVSTDDNLEGEAPYSLTFTVTKISATAYIINIDELNGQQYTGAQFALDSFFEVRDDATGEVVPAAALAGTPEFNIYTQFDEDANDGAGAPVEESKVEFVRDAGTYYIAVSVTGSANYNVTPSQFVTITIEKADLRVRFAGESYSAVYNRASGNTVGSIYTYEHNGRSITPSGVTEIYYLRGAADQIAVQEFVAAYLAALEGVGKHAVAVGEAERRVRIAYRADISGGMCRDDRIIVRVSQHAVHAELAEVRRSVHAYNVCNVISRAAVKRQTHQLCAGTDVAVVNGFEAVLL